MTVSLKQPAAHVRTKVSRTDQAEKGAQRLRSGLLRETHQLMQSANRTVDATSHLPSPCSLRQGTAAPGGQASFNSTARQKLAAAPAEQPAVYTQYELRLLAEMLRTVEQAAQNEARLGYGPGQVLKDSASIFLLCLLCQLVLHRSKDVSCCAG